MKIIAVVKIIVLALVFLSNGVAQAGDAQQENPLFVEARNLWQQISASSLDNDVKAPYGKRFGDLAAEQQSLWSLAGQVDNGACTGRCLDNYNDRVLTWQSRLQSFSNDARIALESNNLPKIGVWTKYGQWTQLNMFCFQTYACGPVETIIHGNDMIVVSTPKQTVKGVCQATRSDPESCGECSATWNPPTDRCLWHLERRE